MFPDPKNRNFRETKVVRQVIMLFRPIRELQTYQPVQSTFVRGGRTA